MNISRGFTLLEVLVAVALSALLTVLAYSALTSSLTAAEQIDISAARLHEIDRSLQLIERDLTQFVGKKWITAFDEMLFVGEGYVDSEPFMQFTRQGWLNPLNRERSHLQRVEYRFSEGGLWRHHWIVSNQADGDEPLSLELFGNVQEMQLRFLSPEQGGVLSVVGGSWQDEWISLNVPPAAVEVRLLLEDMGEIQRVFSLPKGE